jgi:hypothetical protein
MSSATSGRRTLLEIESLLCKSTFSARRPTCRTPSVAHGLGHGRRRPTARRPRRRMQPRTAALAMCCTNPASFSSRATRLALSPSTTSLQVRPRPSTSSTDLSFVIHVLESVRVAVNNEADLHESCSVTCIVLWEPMHRIHDGAGRSDATAWPQAFPMNTQEPVSYPVCVLALLDSHV